MLPEWSCSRTRLIPLKKNPKSKTVGMLLLLSESDRIQEFTSSKVQTVYAESYTLNNGTNEQKEIRISTKSKKNSLIAWFHQIFAYLVLLKSSEISGLSSFSLFRIVYEVVLIASEYYNISLVFISTKNALRRTKYPGRSYQGTCSLTTTVLLTYCSHSVKKKKNATPLFASRYDHLVSLRILSRSEKCCSPHSWVFKNR